MYELCKKRYTWARYHLLGMLLLTVVNLVWLLIYPTASSLFTASLPMMATRAAMALYYLEMPLYTVILCGIAAVLLLAAYFVCWVRSKDRGGWMIAAMVLFAVDVLGMVFLEVFSFLQAAAEGMLPDLFVALIWAVFEVWVFVFLLRGVIAHHKMRKIDNA